MLKLLSVLFLGLFLTTSTSIYTISIPSTSGDTLSISAYQGKKILIVNTALNSNYTYQLMGLQQLYQLHQDSLIIIAVPSNSFGNEPNDDSTISAQLHNLFNISFPIAARTDVNGLDISPLYKWLTQGSENGVFDNYVQDDFTKYLLDTSGNLIGIFKSTVEPMGLELGNVINGIE